MKFDTYINENILNEKKLKPTYGNKEDFNYAVQLQNVKGDFFKAPFGRQLDDWKIIKDFQKNAKQYHIDAKGKPTLKAVKEWVKMVKPNQFFAQWKKDSTNWKSDNVLIYYM